MDLGWRVVFPSTRSGGLLMLTPQAWAFHALLQAYICAIRVGEELWLESEFSHSRVLVSGDNPRPLKSIE